MTQSAPMPAKSVIDIHGHRGARGLMPENSLEGFAYALSIGIKFLELDVQLCGDGVIVATHDLHLASHATRYKDGRWLEDVGPDGKRLEIAKMRFTDLQRYDVGGLKAGTEYADRFPDQAFMSRVAIPSLDEVFELVKDFGEGDEVLNIEIKTDSTLAHHQARTQEVAEAIASCVKHHGFEERVLLQSFDWPLMEKLAELVPHISRAYLTLQKPEIPDGGKGAQGTVYSGSPWIGSSDFDAHGGSIPAMVAEAKVPIWAPFHKDLTQEDLDLAHSLGLMVNVWTVNETQDIERVISMGVDGIISDYPSRVQRLLLARDMHWLKDDQR